MLCLMEIEKLLQMNVKTLKDFECMPSIDLFELDGFQNILLVNELRDEMLAQHNEYFMNLNCD